MSEVHSVDIYPAGIDGDLLNLPKPSRLVFPSKELKEQYIKRENKYCQNEMSAHGAAMTLEARYETRKALFAKRVEFAKKMGFGPSLKAKHVWNHPALLDDSSTVEPA